MCKITVLDIHFEHDGVEASFHPVLLSDKKNLILVDTSYAGFLPLIEEAIADVGEDITRLSTIILTSSELDHIGAVPEFLEKYPDVKVWATEQERRYLEKERIPKTISTLMLRTGLSHEQFEEPIASYAKMLFDLPAIHVDEIVKSRDFKHIVGGLEIIGEAYQTMLYADEDKLLIAGDVFKIGEDGTLQIGDIGYGLSIKDLMELLNYISSFDIEAISCFHGGLYTENVKEKLAEIVLSIAGKLTLNQTEEIDPDAFYLDIATLTAPAEDSLENLLKEDSSENS